jgi:hypothetical protein
MIAQIMGYVLNSRSEALRLRAGSHAAVICIVVTLIEQMHGRACVVLMRARVMPVRLTKITQCHHELFWLGFTYKNLLRR